METTLAEPAGPPRLAGLLIQRLPRQLGRSNHSRCSAPAQQIFLPWEHADCLFRAPPWPWRGHTGPFAALAQPRETAKQRPASTATTQSAGVQSRWHSGPWPRAAETDAGGVTQKAPAAMMCKLPSSPSEEVGSVSGKPKTPKTNKLPPPRAVVKTTKKKSLQPCYCIMDSYGKAQECFQRLSDSRIDSGSKNQALQHLHWGCFQ